MTSVTFLTDLKSHFIKKINMNLLTTNILVIFFLFDKGKKKQ